MPNSPPTATLTIPDGRRIILTGRTAALAVWLAEHAEEVDRDHASVRFDWATGPAKVKVERSFPAVNVVE